MHRTSYICAPCRLRVAAPRQRSSISTVKIAFPPLRQFASSRRLDTESVRSKDATAPEGPSDEHGTTPQIDHGQSVRSSESAPDKFATGSNERGIAGQPRDETATYKQLLKEHTSVQSSILAFKKSGTAAQETHEHSLQERVENLEKALSKALSGGFAESSRYRYALENFTRSARKMSRTFAHHASHKRKSSKQEKGSVRGGSGDEQLKETALTRRVLTDPTETTTLRTAAVQAGEPSRPPGRLRVRARARRSSRRDLAQLGLALSQDQQAFISQSVPRFSAQFADQDVDDPQVRQAVRIKVSAVFLDQAVVDSVVGLVCDRIKSNDKLQRPTNMSDAHTETNSKQGSEFAKPKSAEDRAPRQLPSSAFQELSGAMVQGGKLQLKPIEVEQPPVRGLTYGLDRVLFNPGVYRLQELRSKVYNFDPYLSQLIPVQDFNFDLLPGFITSSKDTKLLEIARESKAKYTGSSSSMTAVLAQFHFLLSRFRRINLQMLSRSLPIRDFHHDFTMITKTPASIFLRLKDGVYAIDSDKEFASTSVLSLLGNSLEKLLTLDKADYVKYRRDSPDKIPEETQNAPETYHYTVLGNVLMRSQLDAHDPRLPGTGMFDLKTRAIFPIRMDVDNYQKGRDYEIKHQFAKFESFEREYLDMLRATMIKYMLQVRIGRMDGIYVAYHNTQRIFGFQYIPLEEIDLALHGQYDRSLGDEEFKHSVNLMNEIMDKATERFPNTSVRLLFRTMGGRNPNASRMYIFAEPVTEEQANASQHKRDEQVAAVAKEIMAGKYPTYDGKGQRIVNYSVEENEARRYGALASVDGSGEPTEDESPVSDSGSTEGIDINSFFAKPYQSGQLSDHKHVPESDGKEGAIHDSDDDSVTSASETACETESASSQLGATKPGSETASTGDSSFVDEAFADSEAAAQLAESKLPLLAMELKITNFVNGASVVRPGFADADKQTPSTSEDWNNRQEHASDQFSNANNDEWNVQYKLQEITDLESAWSLYLSAQKARSILSPESKDRDRGLESIRQVGRDWSEKGREWRAKRNEEDAGGSAPVVFGDNSSKGP